MILVIIKTGKRVVATVGTVALQGSWSGGRRGNVPPKSDWSAVVYQQLAACLARPVIKYCWSSRGKNIIYRYYRPKLQIRLHDLQLNIDTCNFIPTFLLYNYIQIIYIYKTILKKIFDSGNFEVKKILYTVVCVIATTFISILWKLKTCICFHTAWTP